MAGTVWLLDLDNTLHDARQHIFPHINRSMTRYVAHWVGCDDTEADRLRTLYWRRYGATLTGMMRHHATPSRHFLWHTHQFPHLHEMLLPAPRLHHSLRALPGRRLLFSNSPAFYSRSVLRLLGVRPHFSGLFTIESMRHQPKPLPSSYLSLLRAHRLSAARCVLVDDVADNLRAAKRLGMRTVWVCAERKALRFVDLRIGSFAQLPKMLHRLRRGQ